MSSVTSVSLNGQTNKSALISFLIQTKWRINYLIFECNYQKLSWGSVQWIFIKWMLLWAIFITLNFYDATPVVNPVKSTASERYINESVADLQLYRSHLSQAVYLSTVLPEGILITASHCHSSHKPISSGTYKSTWQLSLLIWIKLV